MSRYTPAGDWTGYLQSKAECRDMANSRSLKRRRQQGSDLGSQLVDNVLLVCACEQIDVLVL